MHPRGLVSNLGKAKTITLLVDCFCWLSLKRDIYHMYQLAKIERHNTGFYTSLPTERHYYGLHTRSA